MLRLVLPIWGFFAGFAFGAGLVAELADERFLGTVLGWVLGLVFALIFAVFAYLYYAVAVILAMAAFGFAIGSGLVVALGIDWNWVAVLVGVAVGAVVGLVSVFGEHADDRARRPQLLRWCRRRRRRPDAAGGLAELRRLHPGRVHRCGRGRLGLVPELLVLALVGIFAQARQAAMMRRNVRKPGTPRVADGRVDTGPPSPPCRRRAPPRSTEGRPSSRSARNYDGPDAAAGVLGA